MALKTAISQRRKDEVAAPRKALDPGVLQESWHARIFGCMRLFACRLIDCAIRRPGLSPLNACDEGQKAVTSCLDLTCRSFHIRTGLVRTLASKVRTLACGNVVYRRFKMSSGINSAAAGSRECAPSQLAACGSGKPSLMTRIILACD